MKGRSLVELLMQTPSLVRSLCYVTQRKSSVPVDTAGLLLSLLMFDSDARVRGRDDIGLREGRPYLDNVALYCGCYKVTIWAKCHQVEGWVLCVCVCVCVCV